MKSRRVAPHETSLLEPERLVREFQRPLYNLAYRMLGHESDAADATQEILALVLRKRGRFDPSRPLRPWVYRIATREILRLARSNRARREREIAAEEGMRRDRWGKADPLEREERDQLVQRGIRNLDRRLRVALVLYYYNDLSLREVADVLSLPRTTVQSQLKLALERVRRSLLSSGYSVSILSLEELLQSAPFLEIPGSLQSGVVPGLASGGSEVGAGISSAIGGGGVVSKGMIGIGVGGAVFLLSLGFGVGRWSADVQDEDLSREKSVASASRMEHREDPGGVRGGKSGEDARFRSRGSGANGDPEPINATRSEASSALGPDPEADLGSKQVAPDEGSGIEWSRFKEALEKSIERFIAFNRGGEEGDEPPMTAEDQALLMEFMTEAMKVTVQAKSIAENPFFDERILPELLDAILAGPLGLGRDQMEALGRESLALLQDELAEKPFDSWTPTEMFLRRRDLLANLEESIDRMVFADQETRWRDWQETALGILGGSAPSLEIGLDGGDGSHELFDFWRKEFSLDSAQQHDESFRSLAELYAQDARGLLEKYDQWGQETRTLDPDEEARYQREWLELQVRFEPQLHSFLTPEQRRASRRQDPTLVRFFSGEGVRHLGVAGGMF